MRRLARKCDRGPRIRGRFARFVFGGLASTRITSIRVTGSASEIARLVPVNIRAVVVSKTHRRCWWWHPRCWRSHRRRRGRAWRRGQHRQPAKRRKWGGSTVSVRCRSIARSGKIQHSGGLFFSRPMHRRARSVTAARATRENVNARAQIVLNPRSHSNPGSLRGWVQRSTSALTVKVESAARREVSSAEARVTTEARLGAAGATARARRDSVLPTKAGRATTVEAAEVMAAILST